MEINLTTPALLFPAISLLLLAYTNRFLAISGRIRKLHDEYRNIAGDILIEQIEVLRKRVTIIRNMQFCGVSSIFLCVVCMFILFAGQILLGKIVFGLSLFLLLISLAISLRKILLSVHALNIQLSDLCQNDKKS